MKNRALFRNIGVPLLVLALFWGLITLRAMPALFRGSYTTEGGEWLSQMWRLGFLKSLPVIRPDYCVLGNLVVLQLSEWVNAFCYGANVDHAPMIQHHLSIGYLAVMFTFIFSLLRRNHGLWPSLIVCLAMLAVPDLDDENRIFGEATNLGYFSALVVLFLFYDLWLNPHSSTRRLVAYGLMVVFHVATSPMAGIITAAWAALFGVRLLMDKGLPKKPLIALLAPLIVFSLFTIVRSQQCGPAAAHPDMAIFKRSFVEVVLARQLLYPLITNVFVGFSDRSTLICVTLLLGLIGWYAVYEWRHEKRQWQRLVGTLIVFGAAAGMALATAYSRQWIYAHEAHYASLWPARYYIAQNMAAMGFMVLVVLRVCELQPRLKTAALALASILGTDYAMQQAQKTGRYLAQDSPHIVARYWPYQFRRVHAVQALVGDSEEAKKQAATSPFYSIEININGHFMQMSSDQIERAVATPLVREPDAVPVAFVDAASMKAEDREYSRTFHSEAFRIIPRQGGVLVTFDLRLDDVPGFDVKRRRLWLGKLAGQPKAAAFGYEIPKADRSIAEMRKDKKPQNRLFKVYLYFQGPWSPEALRQQFAGLPCVLGESAGKYIASTVVLDPGERPCLSSFTGDNSFALRLHPLKTVFEWDGNLKNATLLNCAAKNNQVSIKPTRPEDFNEDAFLQNNPDIANAVAKHAVTSGKAYYDVMGRDELRQICHHSVTLPVSGSLTTNTVAGIWVQLSRDQGLRPPSITCVLHGDAGQATSARLRPAEGETQYEVYFLPETWVSPPHPVKTLELQFEGVSKDGRAFTIDEVKLYSQ